MPISLQQYRIGIIYFHKTSKINYNDTIQNKDPFVTVNNLKIPLMIKLSLLLFVIFFVVDGHLKYQNEIKTNIRTENF